MIARLLAFLIALSLLALGGIALGSVLAPDLPFVAAAGGALAKLGAGAALGLVPGGAATALGLVSLLLALRRRGDAAPASASDGDELPGVDPRLARKAAKQAAAMAKKGALADAGELCFATGLMDPAAEYFEQAGDLIRAAEIRHDQNRFAESAELYVRAGKHETAGTIFASQNEHGRAADCYVKAGRLSVAAEMYEKAGQHAKAGDCYAKCEFHRHAAQSFLKAQDWPRAAKTLEQVIVEDGRRTGAGQDPAKEADLRKMVLQAAKLYERAGDPAAAQRVLERGECWAPAAEIAERRGDHEHAADFFQRAGDPQRAAKALQALGDEKGAAQLLGEWHRDRGDEEEAARLLVQATDFAAAGDLYRKLEDYKLAGECYERQGDAQQAAEMFRLGGDPERAAQCYERIGRHAEAAECWAQQGDVAREAASLTQAGMLLRAGEVLAQGGQTDEAIKALQQVRADDPGFASACALLGEIFTTRGKPGLAITKLRQAIGESALDAGTIALFYALAAAHEAAGEVREAAALFEKILAADYHYRDVEARLERVRSAVASLPPLPSLGADTATPPSSRPGRYRVVGELGRGGMGIVYKAEDTVLDRPVAFKVLPDALRDNPQALKNFLREAKAAAKLNHPNIVTVYDAGEQDGRYYIAMEYVDGTTLKEIVRKRGVISPTGVLHVMLQMCEALAYAHAQKVVHRDIKTANTMWTRDKKAKIMDFGLAKVVEEVRNHTTLVSGTPYYMSPEQTLGKNVDHRTDLYSLGVTLFELATGALPFKEGNVPYHHVHTPPPEPRSVNPKLPPELAAIIFRCLQKNPDDRFQDAGEIVERVRAMLAR